jgi:hypothetical protein
VATYVYVVKEEPTGNIKVGVSHDPSKRMNSLQIGTPRRLSLVESVGPFTKTYAHHVEKKIHESCEEWCLGGEWFSSAAADYLGVEYEVV